MKTKRILSTILCLIMVATLCSSKTNLLNRTNVQGETKKTVYEEIRKPKISEQKLAQIAKSALKDGEGVAKEINQYNDNATYEAAVNSALTAYYSQKDFSQLYKFKNTIDNRSKDIVKGYELAKEERDAGDSNGYEAGTVLVSFDKGTTKDEIEAVVNAEYGECESIFECYDGDYMATVSISLGQTVDMAEEAYSGYSVTEIAASNDYLTMADSTTNSATGSVNDANVSEQYYLDSIDAKRAWDFVSQKEHQQVLVGVIDTGIQVDHPDLQGMISPDSGDVTVSSDGVVPFSQCETTYTTAHGTQVAGVIAAKANNNINIAGVASCYNNDIVKVLALQTGSYSTYYEDYVFQIVHIIRAINYCRQKGVKVINFSGGSNSINPYLEQEIKEAVAEGIIFVCSAGNDGNSNTYGPADIDEAISVVATTATNELAFFSNYGPKKDICAPGEFIKTLTIGGGTDRVDGTSFASPITAAVAAMMCSINPNLNYTDVRRILIGTATNIGMGDLCKGELVDAYDAVKVASNYDASKPVIKPEEEGLFNVAKYKSVTTSSTLNPQYFPESNLVDDNDNTKWISENAPGQSITIDLNKVHAINNIEIKYERTIKSKCQVLLSQDGQTWTEISYDNLNDVTSNNVQADLRGARYVKINYLENTSYVIIFEIRVWGYNIVEEQTTQETVERPLEVIGMSATCIAPNMIGVRWQEDEDRLNKGYKYNIYVNDIIYKENINCGYTIIGDLPEGNATVRVTAVLNGYESQGAEKNIVITGVNQPTTEPVTQPPTEETTVVVQGPLEVIGVVVSNPADNTIGVVWGQDNDRIESGCKYNVYVNGVKYFNNVDCNYYTINNIPAGTATVKVTATLNGIESTGVIQTINVTGESGGEVEVTTNAPEVEETTTVEVTTEEATTVEEETTVEGEVETTYTISDVNIASGKTAYASSNESDSMSAGYAFDGNMGTRWSSGWSDNEWVYVDLGESYDVARVKLFWEGAFASQFKIQVSNDANTWTDVAELGDTYCKDYDVEISPVNARYVRMLGVTRGTTYGYSLYEIEVYAAEYSQTEVPEQDILLSLNKMSYASSSESDALMQGNAFDGNMGTRWSSGWSDNEWIYVDLGQSYYVSYVDLVWESAYASSYQVQVSNDGLDWKIVNSVVNGNGQTERTQINENARYVKMQGISRITEYGYSLYEMNVFGH